MSDKSRERIRANVAAILKQERKRQKISMTALAQKTGLSQQMVSYVERELRNPTLDTLLRITAALNLSLAEVLRRAEQH